MRHLLLIIAVALAAGCSLFRPKPTCEPMAIQMYEPSEIEYWDPELMIAEHDE